MNATTTWDFAWPGRLLIAQSFYLYGDKKCAVGVHGRLSRLTKGWQSQIVWQGCRAGASSGFPLRTCRLTFLAFVLGLSPFLFAQESLESTREEAAPEKESPNTQKTKEQNLNTVCQTKPNSAPEMVVIPSGTFVMGSPSSEEGRWASEGPQRQVKVEAFAIGRCEVTFADWQLCIDDGVCDIKNDSNWGRAQRPVINVSWDDTQTYINWLNTKTGGSYRLPTEAEWEYAARAVTTTAYSWGDNPSGQHENGSEDDGWPEDGYTNQTSPAASFKANPWGLYDMHGNVREWVEDCWHVDYSEAPPDSTAWQETNGGDCSRRVIRSGSWISSPQYLRSACRSGLKADDSLVNLGFRLARTLEKNKPIDAPTNRVKEDAYSY